jgi:ClpX C4-type zinc finger protein
MNGATNLLRKFLIGFQPPLRCVGCNRLHFEVEKLVSGPKVYICDVCAGEAAKRVNAYLAAPKQLICSFCGGQVNVVPVGADEDQGTCASCVAIIQGVLKEAEARM